MERCDHSIGDENELILRLQNVECVGIRSTTRVTRRLLECCPGLCSIGCFCIGTNQVDLKAAESLGIPVFNAPFCSSRSVAELIVAQIINLSRQLGTKNLEMHGGRFMKSAVGCHQINNRVLGIVGYGHCGSSLSIMAEALGMRVLFWDTATPMPHGNARPTRSLEELLGESDFVSLHVPLAADTRNMMNAARFAQMKQGSYLLNASRGNVVVLGDLLKALQSGKLAGAYLDVFPYEPTCNGAWLPPFPHLVAQPVMANIPASVAAVDLPAAVAVAPTGTGASNVSSSPADTAAVLGSLQRHAPASAPITIPVRRRTARSPPPGFEEADRMLLSSPVVDLSIVVTGSSAEDEATESMLLVRQLVQERNVILSPHIGGSTVEAQAAIAEEVSQRLLAFWHNGSTMQAVNLPGLTLPKRSDCCRLLNIHRNVPGALKAITTCLQNYNIAQERLCTMGDIGYCMIDIDVPCLRRTAGSSSGGGNRNTCNQHERMDLALGLPRSVVKKCCCCVPLAVTEREKGLSMMLNALPYSIRTRIIADTP